MTRLAEALFHLQQLFALAFEHAADGHAGPAADDLGDLLGGHFFLHHRLAGSWSDRGACCLACSIWRFRFADFAVLDAGGGLQISLPLGLFQFDLFVVQLLLERLDRVASPPTSFSQRAVKPGVFLLQLGQFFFGFVQLLLAEAGSFSLAQGFELDLQLHDPPADFVQLRGHGIVFDAQPAGGFVDQVDGLVGQETVGDVAVAQARRRRQSRRR